MGFLHSNHPPQPPYPPPPGGYYMQYPPYPPQPPPHQVYYQQNYNNQVVRRRSGCCHCYCCCCCFILLIISITSMWLLLNYLVLRSEIPSFHIQSLSISDFNATSPLTSTWNAKLTVDNSDKNYNLEVRRIQVFIESHSKTIGKTRVDDIIKVDKRSKKDLEFVVKANSTSDPHVSDTTVKLIENERNRDGAVKFGLQMHLIINFKSESTWNKQTYMMIFCKNLVVKLPQGSNKGDLSTGNVRSCSLHYLVLLTL